MRYIYVGQLEHYAYGDLGLAKFDDLPLGPAPGYVGVVAYQVPDKPYEVAAITGATQTSKSLERLLNDGIAAFLAAVKGGTP